LKEEQILIRRFGIRKQWSLWISEHVVITSNETEGNNEDTELLSVVMFMGSSSDEQM